MQDLHPYAGILILDRRRLLPPSNIFWEIRFRDYFNHFAHIIFMRKPAPRPARKVPKDTHDLKLQELPPVPPSLETKETATLREIRDMQMEIENVKKAVLSETNMRSLEHDLTREFQKMSKEVKESLEKNSHAIDRMEAEVKFLKEDIGRVMGLEEEMNRLNMKSLTRDVEGLKEKKPLA